MVKGFNEAVSHDSKKVQNTTAYKRGIESLVFLAALINIEMR